MMVHNDKSTVHYEGWSRIDFDKPEMDVESLMTGLLRVFQWADLRGYLQETKVYAPN